jgi:hypothetical protein
MLPLNQKDPIVDNPFRLLGLSGIALQSKTVEEGVDLARAVARALKDSEKAPTHKKRLAASCIDELRNPERAKAAFEAFKGLSPDAVVSRLVAVANQHQKISTQKLEAAWLYKLEEGAAPSLHNAVRMSSAAIEVTDIVSMLQSPIRETSEIARKLFKKTITSVGDGRIEHGAPIPVENETRREMIGVLNLRVAGRQMEFRDIERVVRELGLINSSSHCLPHYRLPAPETSGVAQKVEYPRPQHDVFSHFHSIHAVERLLVVHVADIHGGIRAQIPKTDGSSCNILLSRAICGPTATLCIEGIIESIKETPRVSESTETRSSGSKENSPKGKRSKTQAKKGALQEGKNAAKSPKRSKSKQV